MPAAVMLSDENVAVPPTAETTLPVADCDDGVSVIDAVDDTGFPNWSCTFTVTAGLIALPATMFDGCTPNASLLPAPANTLNGPLAGELVRFVADATSV